MMNFKFSKTLQQKFVEIKVDLLDSYIKTLLNLDTNLCIDTLNICIVFITEATFSQIHTELE